MVLEGLNEQGVGVASLLTEFICSSLDFDETAFSPYLPMLNVEDLLFDRCSVVLSLLPVGLVNVGDLGQLGDGVSSDGFNLNNLL